VKQYHQVVVIPTQKFAIKSNKGMGLGFYCSKRIIEAHEGRIWTENNPDRNGVQFTFNTSFNLTPGSEVLN
jgi:K+-sensing histidine kinase KdpD